MMTAREMSSPSTTGLRLVRVWVRGMTAAEDIGDEVG